MSPFATPVVELLVTIPGVGKRVAEVIIADIGVDMAVFPSDAHLASWAAVCPGNNSSAGKHHSGHTRKGNVWLLDALTQAGVGRRVSKTITCRRSCGGWRAASARRKP